MQKEFIFYDQLNTGSNSSGFIYVLSNPAYPDWVKIGRTTRLPSYRAAELSKTTSAPTPFYVEWSRFLGNDLSEIETKIHEELDGHRVNKKREFFKMPVSEAIKQAGVIIDNYFSGIFINKWYRKKQDARWGLFFELLKIPFWYIKKPMNVIDGVGFMPDFWLRDQKCFVIVSKDFLNTDTGKLMGYCFAKEKDKVMFQLWDCQPGFNHDKDGDLNFHTGSYLTPEGEYGGLVEVGICNHCGSKHIGRHGFPELGDRAGRHTSKNSCKCHTADENEALLKAYRSIPVCFGDDN